MNKRQYIRSRFDQILKESLQEKADSLMTKLNYDEETELYPENEFDYVEEEMNEGETCEQCGGEIKEGETCEQCGGKGEVMELGGMEDSHPKFGNKNLSKLTKKQMEDLLYGMEDEEDEDEDYKPRKRNKRDNDEELDESWYSHDEYERIRDFGDEDELQAYQDKLVSGGKEDETEQLYEVEFDLEIDEEETVEGNAFTGALAKAKKEGKDTFEVDGKKYDVKESYITEKWKGDVEVEQTGEYSDMSIKELNSAITKLKKQNDKFKEDGKKVPQKNRTKMSQLYFAKRAKQGWKGKGKAKVKESILYTESDLIDLIENIVVEEKKFKKSEPKGYREYERAHKADKKENDDYLKSVAKKMTDYLKGMSDDGSKYEMKETKKFPTENGGMKKGNRKKYTPSDAVDEYIDAFSYPGQTNLVYDEIKPNDEWIEDLLKGSSRTGNAQVDKDGNALGNVVPSKTGEKFYNNFKDNLYGQEQMNASYKRQPQPVDQAGEETERGSLKSKRGKKTAQSVLNKLEESVETKKDVKLNEEFDRIQLLMGYNRKTQ